MVSLTRFLPALAPKLWRSATGLLFATLMLSPSLPMAAEPAPAAPLVGFSFSPKEAVKDGLDPQAALGALVDRVRPDLVRIPVYWDEVAPRPDGFDFAAVDSLLATVAARSRSRHRRPTRIVLVVGARNIGTPEVYVPDWVAGVAGRDLAAVASLPEYAAYLAAAVVRYRANSLLYGWQVENEPLDNVHTGDWLDVSLTVPRIESEVQLVHELDASHPVVVTSFTSASVALDLEQSSRLDWLYQRLPGARPAGHPLGTLPLADALGLDLYVVTPNADLRHADVKTRIAWKQAGLTYWAARARAANKQLWVTEMQAAPWNGAPGFTEADLVDSAGAYRSSGPAVVMMWGVEGWLSSPSWMAAGQRAVGVLRA